MKFITLIFLLSIHQISSIAQENLDSLFVMAVKANNIKRVKKLMKKGVDINVKTSETPGSPTYPILHFSLRYSNYKMAKLLIKKGADVNSRDEDGAPPLSAFRYNAESIELAKQLLKKGADVNAQTPKDANYNAAYTALHFAVKYEDFMMVKLLLKYHADISIKNEKGKRPLDLAKEIGNKQIIKILSS